MTSLHKNIQLMLEFLKGPFLVLHICYYTLMTSLMTVSVILLCADDTTLYSKRNQASDLWQQLQLASEGESDLRETVDCGKKYFRLTSIIRLVLLMGKRISLFMKKHHLLRCWVSLPNWIGALTLSLLLKLLLKKLEP